MSNSSPGNHIIRNSSGGSEYANASWETGDGESIPDFSLDTTIPGKYKATMTNILSKHCIEIKTVSEDITQPLTSISRKKLKELITKHNNDIFLFMARPERTPSMIGLAETIFRRYGQDIPTIKGNTANTIVRDLNLDLSMCDVIKEFDDNLKKINTKGGLDDFMKQTRWIINQYKNCGEEVLRLETILFQKIDLLDKLNSRTPLITSLANNEVLPELINTFTKYAESVYKTSQLEDTYKELVEAYKKWNICRQIISSHSIFRNESQDPMCSICLTEQIVTAIVPCGHTFCGTCIKKQNTTCYICRGTIRERIKLYFS